ncbi:MAG: site-2 protease family protein [Candidatus Hodarchaeota archaeon]
MYVLGAFNGIIDCNYCGNRANVSFRSDNYTKMSYSSNKIPKSIKSRILNKKPQEVTSSEPYTGPPLRLPLKGRLIDARSQMGFAFSKSEILHLLGGILMVVFVELTLFPLLFSWFLPVDMHLPTGIIPPANTHFILALIIVLTSGFFLHEFSHKFVARRLGHNAEFRLVRYSSYLTLVSTILPFRIIAPGAVMIYLDEDDKITQEEFGKIALAGPTANTIMGFSLILMAFLSMNPDVFLIGILGSTFCVDLAWFNLMPVSILDGAKVRRWSETAWATVFIAACLLKLASLLILLLI